jgi:hypothetical protein
MLFTTLSQPFIYNLSRNALPLVSIILEENGTVQHRHQPTDTGAFNYFLLHFTSLVPVQTDIV